jgi:aryl-alcohol dehydrogenase-like predicted oxidoreductase
VLASKARFGTGPDVNETGTGRRNLDRALTASLRRLGLEQVDLYQMHGWDPITPIDETLHFLDDAVRAGKINYIGLSNFTGWQMQLTLSTAAALGLQLPVTLQPQYNLVSREIEYEIVPAALHNHIGLLPWSPLASGFLTGKYEQGAKPPSGARMGSGSPFSDRTFRVLAAKEQNWATLDAVREIAQSVGATPSQVALSWLTNRPSVTSPIVGARTLKHLEESLVGADLELDAAATRRLDDVSAPTPGDYPYGPFGEKQRGRYVDSSEQVIREL